ncbi:MAG: PqqD family protein [Deltaproteobacteria bacterium]|nr:PqqD family protein [Deltaproteobacteria bacterium]
MRRKNRANFLDYIPSRKVDCTLDPDGRQVLLIPKFGTGRFGRWWSSVIGKRSTLKVHLDEMGSRAWNAIDGKRTVGEISRVVGHICGNHDDEVYDRCSRFIRSLSNAGTIHLDPPADP